MKFIVWPVLYVTITYYDILSSEFLLLIITILLLHCYDIIITLNDLIFFLQQKATFLQVVLAISKSQSTAGFRV